MASGLAILDSVGNFRDCVKRRRGEIHILSYDLRGYLYSILPTLPIIRRDAMFYQFLCLMQVCACDIDQVATGNFCCARMFSLTPTEHCPFEHITDETSRLQPHREEHPTAYPRTQRPGRSSIDGLNSVDPKLFAGKAGIRPQLSTQNNLLSRRGKFGSASSWMNQHAVHNTSSCHSAASLGARSVSLDSAAE